MTDTTLYCLVTMTTSTCVCGGNNSPDSDTVHEEFEINHHVVFTRVGRHVYLVSLFLKLSCILC